jgi:hypothetical protein
VDVAAVVCLHRGCCPAVTVVCLRMLSRTDLCSCGRATRRSSFAC